MFDDNVSTREKFIVNFNDSTTIRGNATAKNTIGLFWCNPSRFLPLDKNTVGYIRRNLDIEIPKSITKIDGAKYLDLVEELNQLKNSSADPPFDSFFHLSWLAWIASSNPSPPPPPPPPPPATPYDISAIVREGSFLSTTKLKDIMGNWKRKKNLILQGPPGTGKTWLARRLAYTMLGSKDEGRVASVQFHPNLSYEDFVRGYRPGPDGDLEIVNGTFMDIAGKADIDRDNDYVLIIEEINRGNRKIYCEFQ